MASYTTLPVHLMPLNFIPTNCWNDKYYRCIFYRNKKKKRKCINNHFCILNFRVSVVIKSWSQLPNSEYIKGWVTNFLCYLLSFWKEYSNLPWQQECIYGPMAVIIVCMFIVLTVTVIIVNSKIGTGRLF